MTFLKTELPLFVAACPACLLEAVFVPRFNQTMIIVPNVIPKAQVLVVESPENDRGHAKQGLSVRDAPTLPHRVCSGILDTDVIRSVERKSEEIVTDRTFLAWYDSSIRASTHAQDLTYRADTPFTSLLEDNFRILSCIIDVEEDSEDEETYTK